MEHVRQESLDSIPSTERDIYRCELEGVDRQNVSSALARASDRLFEWARLACAFVKNDNEGGVQERFELVLAHNTVNLLDSIYILTLETIFPKTNTTHLISLHRFRSAQIIATAEPLPLASFQLHEALFRRKRL